METYVIKNKRTITAEEQHKCDVCQEPATTGCTDAIELSTGWHQSEPRYGCPEHPVKPVIQYLTDAHT